MTTLLVDDAPFYRVLEAKGEYFHVLRTFKEYYMQERAFSALTHQGFLNMLIGDFRIHLSISEIFYFNQINVNLLL